MQRVFRAMVGTMVLMSVLLTVYVHANWVWLTVFIGVNLLQSAITGWCPAMMILKKCGLK